MQPHGGAVPPPHPSMSESKQVAWVKLKAGGRDQRLPPSFSADKKDWLITPSSNEVGPQAQAGFGAVASSDDETLGPQGEKLAATIRHMDFTLNPVNLRKAFGSSLAYVFHVCFHFPFVLRSLEHCWSTRVCY